MRVSAMKFRKSFTAAAVLILMGASLAGCVAYPAGYGYGYGYGGYGGGYYAAPVVVAPPPVFFGGFGFGCCHRDFYGWRR